MQLSTLWKRLGFVLPAHLADDELKVLDLDADSTLLNLCAQWYGDYNAATGDDLTVAKVLSWDTHKYAQHGKLVYKYITPVCYNERCQPLPGAVEFTRQASRYWHLRVITTGDAETFAAKLSWFSRWMPWIEDIRPTQGTKIETCPDIQLLIDDGPHNFDGGFFAGIMPSYPFNSSAQLRQGVKSVEEPYWAAISSILLP